MELFLVEKLLIVVVNFFIRSDLHAKVELKDAFFECVIGEVEVFAVLEQLVMRKQVEVPAAFIHEVASPTEGFERAEGPRDSTNYGSTGLVVVHKEAVADGQVLQLFYRA